MPGNFGNIKSFHSFASKFLIPLVETKDRIIQAAEELFFKYGIKSITMDDIAKHLAISKKTIYAFFEDKNQIVHTLMAEKLKEDECMIKLVADKSANIVEEVFNTMKHFTTMFTRVNPNVFYELQKHYPATWQLFREFKESFILNSVQDSLLRGKEQGLVRTDLNHKILARLRMEEVSMGFNPIVYPPDKFKIVDVQVNLIEHFLYGICTLKGHKLINKYRQLIEEE